MPSFKSNVNLFSLMKKGRRNAIALFRENYSPIEMCKACLY